MIADSHTQPAAIDAVPDLQPIDTRSALSIEELQLISLARILPGTLSAEGRDTIKRLFALPVDQQKLVGGMIDILRDVTDHPLVELPADPPPLTDAEREAEIDAQNMADARQADRRAAVIAGFLAFSGLVDCDLKTSRGIENYSLVIGVVAEALMHTRF